MNEAQQYETLVKPSWAPPTWIFGPVWTLLYLIIFVSFGLVFYKYFKRNLPFIVILPFLLNLIFNFAYTPIQFGLKNYLLASIDIILIIITLIWALVAILPYHRWVVLINLPYLLWVAYATILQLTITYMNL